MLELTQEEITKIKDFFYVRYNELDKNLNEFHDLIKQNYSTTASNHSLDDFHYIQSVQKWIEFQSKDIEIDGRIRLECWLRYFCNRTKKYNDGTNRSG